MDHEQYLRDLTADFALLGDRERFMHLIELGEQLRDYPQQLRTEEFEVPGCTSLVYMHADLEDGKVFYRGEEVFEALADGGALELAQALAGDGELGVRAHPRQRAVRTHAPGRPRGRVRAAVHRRGGHGRQYARQPRQRVRQPVRVHAGPSKSF